MEADVVDRWEWVADAFRRLREGSRPWSTADTSARQRYQRLAERVLPAFDTSNSTGDERAAEVACAAFSIAPDVWITKEPAYRRKMIEIGRYLVTAAELAAYGKPVPDDTYNPLTERGATASAQAVLEGAVWVGTAAASGILGNAAYDFVKSHFLKITRRQPQLQTLTRDHRVLLAQLAVQARCAELGMEVPNRKSLACSSFSQENRLHLASGDLNAVVEIDTATDKVSVTLRWVRDVEDDLL
ncbi:hypothetical protein [Amycolatopsis sp. NPDC052450]|uniref:hypothetical protein n=1 Tax=Amycolatopsis sp. NPDC052450 TaxID=3363937 RepID=UPI0037CB7114